MPYPCKTPGNYGAIDRVAGCYSYAKPECIVYDTTRIRVKSQTNKHENLLDFTPQLPRKPPGNYGAIAEKPLNMGQNT